MVCSLKENFIFHLLPVNIEDFFGKAVHNPEGQYLLTVCFSLGGNQEADHGRLIESSLILLFSPTWVMGSVLHCKYVINAYGRCKAKIGL